MLGIPGAHEADGFLDAILLVCRQGPRAKFPRAVADHVPVVFSWMRRAAELAERPVRRVRKVGQRIGECSVEIEEHGASSRLHAGHSTGRHGSRPFYCCCLKSSLDTVAAIHANLMRTHRLLVGISAGAFIATGSLLAQGMFGGGPRSF